MRSYVWRFDFFVIPDMLFKLVKWNWIFETLEDHLEHNAIHSNVTKTDSVVIYVETP